jgi:drug/metabolite transporter (DMT)-like permease
LYFATFLWGFSFTWVKQGGVDCSGALGLDDTAVLGPLVFTGWRFVLAAIAWIVIFPRSLTGWTAVGIRRGLLLGILFWIALVFQVAGLARTSEAVCAFFTSLSVVFVPLLLALALRKPPPGRMWIPVVTAAVGIWLMTGAAPTGFGRGEILSLACAFLFSVHLIAIGEIVPREHASRMTLAQFAIAGALSLVTAGFASGSGEAWNPRVALGLFQGSDRVLSAAAVLDGSIPLLNLVVVTVLCTIVAFGLVFRLQPLLSPTRAAIIYLAEPVFAASFAFVAAGRALTPGGLLGAFFILVANGLSEWFAHRAVPGSDAHRVVESGSMVQ